MTQFGWAVLGVPTSRGALSKVVPSDHTPIGMPPNVREDYRLWCRNAAASLPLGTSSDATYSKLEKGGTLATQLCEKCKQAHPGRVCDSDEKGECAETTAGNEMAQPCDEPLKDGEGRDSLRPRATEYPE
jgi:hypothetical protein